MIQNGARGRTGSIYSSFLLILGEGEKTWFFDEVSGLPKNKANRPVERQRLEKHPSGHLGTVKSPGGSRHSRLEINKPQPVDDHTRQRAEGPANCMSFTLAQTCRRQCLWLKLQKSASFANFDQNRTKIILKSTTNGTNLGQGGEGQPKINENMKKL